MDGKNGPAKLIYEAASDIARELNDHCYPEVKSGLIHTVEVVIKQANGNTLCSTRSEPDRWNYNEQYGVRVGCEKSGAALQSQAKAQSNQDNTASNESTPMKPGSGPAFVGLVRNPVIGASVLYHDERGLGFGLSRVSHAVIQHVAHDCPMMVDLAVLRSDGWKMERNIHYGTGIGHWSWPAWLG